MVRSVVTITVGLLRRGQSNPTLLSACTSQSGERNFERKISDPAAAGDTLSVFKVQQLTATVAFEQPHALHGRATPKKMDDERDHGNDKQQVYSAGCDVQQNPGDKPGGEQNEKQN
jgi:hypothetical protein